MKSKLILCISVSLFFCSTLAQEMKNPFSIGPHFGYYESKDADNGNMMLGAALRLRLTNALGFEGSIDYRQEDYNDNSITTKSWPVLITGLVYPTQNIYGALGVGWYNTQIDYQNEFADYNDESAQEFGWHFGAGVEIPLSERMNIASDFRYTFLDYDFKQVPGTEGLSSNYFIVTAGLFFLLN